MSVQKESETAVDPEEIKPIVKFRRDDFALLTDDSKGWIVRLEDISLLEACRNYTFVYSAIGNVFIRRSLASLERRLDASIFFRANKGCIVNLSHVERLQLSKDGGLIFVSKDGKEVVFSRRQSILFRRTRGL